MSAEFWASMLLAAILFGALFGRLGFKKKRWTCAYQDKNGDIFYSSR